MKIGPRVHPGSANLLDLRSRRCSLGQAMAEIEDEDEFEYVCPPNAKRQTLNVER
jgi:hypothetical protein